MVITVLLSQFQPDPSTRTTDGSKVPSRIGVGPERPNGPALVAEDPADGRVDA
jgi:hypothetical protein